MISINATLVIQVIHFLILTFILNRLMFRPILKLIKERTDYVEKTRNEIKNIEYATSRLKKEFFSRKDDARKNATRERAQIKSTGITKTEELLNDSRKEVVSIREEADKEAEKEVKKTQPLLRNEAMLLADEIIERVIGRIAG